MKIIAYLICLAIAILGPAAALDFCPVRYAPFLIGGLAGVICAWLLLTLKD